MDGTMRTPLDGPSIGVLLCERRRGPIVEYTLQNIVQPIGVSTYRVTRELPEPVREELPSVEDLQEVVNKFRDEMESLRQERSNEESAKRFNFWTSRLVNGLLFVKLI
jgi:YhcG PDDEXK nuclease domain